MKLLNRQSLWRNLAKKLTDALEIEQSRIGTEQAVLVAEFIDHNEFGLAHDQLVDALSDLKLIPTTSAAVLLGEARQLMSVNK